MKFLNLILLMLLVCGGTQIISAQIPKALAFPSANNNFLGTITNNSSTADIGVDQYNGTGLVKIPICDFLVDAPMTTYAYAPLLGVTAETDPVGRSIFYEYDGFSRLNMVRDNERKIVKKYCYNYAGQTNGWD